MKKLSRAKRKIQKAKWLKQKKVKPTKSLQTVSLTEVMMQINHLIGAYKLHCDDVNKSRHGCCASRINFGEDEWYWHGKLVKDQAEFNRYESLKAFI